MREKYIAAQNAFVDLFDIKKGSIVKVLRKAPGSSNGWHPMWNPKMDDLVGKELTVSYIDRNNGIQVTTDSYWFPFFVLEFVSNSVPLPDPIPLTSAEEYHAEFRDGGDIWVSGITIPYETLKEIFDKATEVKG